MKNKLNIALLGQNIGWGGGIDLLRNIANALLSMQDTCNIRVFLLLPVKNKVDSFTDLSWVARDTVVKIIRQRKFFLPRSEPAYDASFPDYFGSVDGRIEFVEFNATTGLIPALQKIEASVVIPTFHSLGKTFPFPWVGYIFDFQHKYLADYFSADDSLSRDIRFATMLRDAEAVIVNSASVKMDINKFFQKRECKIFNLPFSAAPVKSWLEVGDTDVAECYGLPSRYLLISNQFWIHKSHSTAFRALALLVNGLIKDDLHIVCTGKMADHRYPDYIRDLQNEVRELGVEDRVHFLGHIPKRDQIEIMKNSLALL